MPLLPTGNDSGVHARGPATLAFGVTGSPYGDQGAADLGAVR
jgi:hypothetical protein